MNNTKIDWATDTWNPITGCLHGCEYCYAREMTKRFGTRKNAYWEMDQGHIHHRNGVDMPILESPIMFLAESEDGGCSGFPIAVNPYPAGFTPTFHKYLLDRPQGWKKPRNIFVVSMGDMFGEWVSDYWIKQVFEACADAPQHNYLFLTKNPQRYNDLLGNDALPLDDNFWYGVTRTGQDTDREHEAPMIGHSFLSVEPMLAPMERDTIGALELFDWVIIGAMSGQGADQHAPKREWVEEIVDYCQRESVPVFLKSSLANVWGDELIQEYPADLAANNRTKGRV